MPSPKRLLFISLSLLFAIMTFDSYSDKKEDIAPEIASKKQQTKTAFGSKGMVVTANAHATDAAFNVLQQGGSAVDAAIAAQMVLGLVEPQSSGIGGGAFLLHWNQRDKKLTAYDGRETAPALLEETHFLNPDGTPMGFFDAVIGGHSVGVPGVVKMLELAHQEHGSLPWENLFSSAIGLANQGFTVSPRLHTLLRWVAPQQSPQNFTDYFLNNGEPLAKGALLKNPAYAESLQLIAQQGSAGFYQGELAQKIVSAVQEAEPRQGKLSLKDLSGYQAIKRQGVCGHYYQLKVCSMPPPSSGGTTILAQLGLLERVSSPDSSSTERIHLFAESSRLAFSDRNHWVADPAFFPVPTDGLFDPVYLDKRAQLISAKKTMADVLPGNPPGMTKKPGSAISPELPSTSHLSIIDDHGNIVSMTSSIETAFGSRVLVGGFLLNNQLTDFSFQPKDFNGNPAANRPQPGKRPRSSMSPTIVFNKADRPVLVIGSPGGARIINYVAQTIMETFAEGKGLVEAIKSPRMIDMGRGLEVESLSKEQQNVLKTLGHQKVTEKPQTSGLHGVIKRSKGWQGVADPRREGTAKGW